MKEIASAMTTMGRVALPGDVCQRLRLGAHDGVAFVLEDDTVQLRAPEYPSVESLRGAAGSLDRRLDWREMREIAREDVFIGSDTHP
jgi:hypothetical protein